MSEYANDGVSPGPGEAGDAGDQRLVAVSRQADRTARRVEKLEGLVRELGDKVTELADFVHNTSPGSGDQAPAGAAPTGGGAKGGKGKQGEAKVPRPPGVRSWLLANDPEQAEADMADLIGWLDRVYLAYPDAHLPTCWLFHPDIVEELWWLRCSHAESYHPEQGSWLRVGDWHDRQRPGVLRRINALVGDCELRLHAPEGSHSIAAPRPPERAPVTSAAAVMAAWMAAGRPDPMPEPTEPQLEAAHALDAPKPRY